MQLCCLSVHLRVHESIVYNAWHQRFGQTQPTYTRTAPRPLVKARARAQSDLAVFQVCSHAHDRAATALTSAPSAVFAVSTATTRLLPEDLALSAPRMLTRMPLSDAGVPPPAC